MRRDAIRKMLCGLALGVALVPGAANAWWNDEWSQRKPLTVDTGASAAGITDEIGTVPVLVRLHAGNFRFEKARDDGADLRFVAGDDKTPLKFHVEKWDGLLGEAFVWVRLQDVRPGTKTPFFVYYGNAKATSAEDAKGSFDPDTTLAYHFGERSQPARDWTAWNNGSLTPVVAADGALIGPGLKLDGQAPVTLPAAPSLTWTEGGTMSWSAWVKPGAAQPEAVLFSRRDGEKYLTIGLAGGAPFVEISGAGRAQGATALPVGSWHHLAVTAGGGGQIALYADGAQVATLAAALPGLAGPAQLGGDSPAPAPVALPTAKGAPPVSIAPLQAGFVGEIDELRLAKTARSAGAIKFDAIGQGADGAKLLGFGPDEEKSSWVSGYFAVILGSVTMDGWVIIAILLVMAALSWVVMVDKAVSLSRLEKANRRFLEVYSETVADWSFLDRDDPRAVASLGGRLTEADSDVVRASSLYRLYRTGTEEIRARIKNGRGRALTAESIAAIRATLDSIQVRETQSLNRLMVMLTIAISGGPFLGLLGTVVGVMITFAAIAASGDVNVNAIAPGIAAALVATVAGLAVAIPALFGYNWLLTRIKNSAATMNVFVDELVTRLAELHRHRADGHAAVPLPLSAE
ncbi:DUF2341 domain-containing protein [Magnetospirillum fulvum]|uniref:Outer membrane transport energization protein ExbB (TC 2.C.1.1.1) n=1 Tax=Magnetospirillum fulvum TaxID=1082 RepID=A0A1H6K2B8_MAGFU|nr:MotA/TolQ/ExbB proton channel family protein [Magnetospirillum fulvum]SEH32950.1 outer membrane transport energization protein ExbB (TC 2.C.1.1.1) [Magnetospirillum fulvum]SEH65883.1 outer membrane transport energization protein ExbB (TC 2.C.1.1.1) [Magnetospirillum fulvum]